MLSQTAIYALRAMGYLATHEDEGPILSQTIAEKMDIPKNFLSKIMNRLVQSGLVQSIRGTKGGFLLAKKPQEISMSEVASLFTKLDDYRKCFLGFKECDESCGVHEQWRKIADQIEKMLYDTTIDNIL